MKDSLIIKNIKNFVSMGKYQDIVFFDFMYKDVNYAYDLYVDNGIFVVDFLIRNNRDIVKKMRKQLDFDTSNKVFSIIKEKKESIIYERIFEIDAQIMKLSNTTFL